jgi:hypothetical protein
LAQSQLLHEAVAVAVAEMVPLTLQQITTDKVALAVQLVAVLVAVAVVEQELVEVLEPLMPLAVVQAAVVAAAAKAVSEELAVVDKLFSTGSQVDNHGRTTLRIRKSRRHCKHRCVR